MNYIFFLPHGPTLGGVEVWSVGMVKELNRRNPGTAFLISFVQDNDGAGFVGGANKHEHCLDIKINPRQLVDTSYFNNVLNDIVQRLPDGPSFIFPNYGSHSYGLAAALKSFDSKRFEIVGVLHSDDSHYYSLARYFSPYISRYIAVSSRILDRLHTRMPWRKDDMMIRPCGIETAASGYFVANRFENMAPPTVCYVGRIASYQKRILDLVVVFATLERQNKRIRFHIVGDGPEGDELRSKVNKMKLHFVEVVFHGRKDPVDVARVMAESHFFCSFSAFEGTSMSLMEALSMGCIPVVTDVSGVRDFVTDEGMIFDIGKTSNFVDKLCALIALPSDRLVKISEELKSRVQSNSLSSYCDWFEVNFREFRDRDILFNEVFRNWDFTWNPVLLNQEQSHPLFMAYERIKSKWWGRVFIDLIQKLFK